jgi:peptide deformylase
MTKKKIFKYGSEVLRRKSTPVKKFDKRIAKLAEDMIQTMYSASGVGLAAPQIGVNQRIIVVDTEYSSDRYENEKPAKAKNPLIMINPEITHMEGEMESFEGCLSFPEVFFNVTRAKKIKFKFQDLKGLEHEMTAEEDLFCRCIQHEIDHLNGQLFVDIAEDKVIARSELDEHGFANVNSQPLA